MLKLNGFSLNGLIVEVLRVKVEVEVEGGKDLMLSRVIVEIEVEGGTDLMLSSLSCFSWSDWSGVCVEPESVGVL